MRDHVNTTYLDLTELGSEEYADALRWAVADKNPTDEYRAAKEYIAEHYNEDGAFDTYESALDDWQSDNDADDMTDWDAYYKKEVKHIHITDMINDFGDGADIFETKLGIHATDDEIDDYIEVIEENSDAEEVVCDD